MGGLVGFSTVGKVGNYTVDVLKSRSQEINGIDCHWLSRRMKRLNSLMIQAVQQDRPRNDQYSVEVDAQK